MSQTAAPLSRCSACDAADRPLKMCSRCAGAWYCSSACQRKSWKKHRRACRATAAELQKSNNNCINFLGPCLLVRYWKCLARLLAPGHPVVSVGSGRGTTEKFLERFADVAVVAVDRAPEKFQDACSLPGMAPVHASAAQAARRHPELVGNCGLFINWPNPEGTRDDPGASSPYDLDAIGALRPRAILLVLDTSGGAGSAALLRWIECCVEGFDEHQNDERRLLDFGRYAAVAGSRRTSVPKRVMTSRYVVVQSTVRKVGDPMPASLEPDVIFPYGMCTSYLRYLLLRRADVDPKGCRAETIPTELATVPAVLERKIANAAVMASFM